MSTTLTIRIDKQVKHRLDNLAKATDRTKSYLVANAIEDFLSVNEWQIQETIKALKEVTLSKTKFVEHANLKTKWEAKLANTVD